METERPTPAPQKQPPPGHDEVSEESLRQIGRCAFGIEYPGDDERDRARCPSGGGCATHGPRRGAVDITDEG